MSFKQCSGCEATVDVSKAYCPDCGASMDEEQKRNGASEYDSLMKTQQISQTTQFKLSEYFNQSSGSAPPPPKDVGKSNEGDTARKSVVFNLQAITSATNAVHKQTENVVSPPTGEFNRIINENAAVDGSSKKKIYVVVGGIILLLLLVLIIVITLGILYWNYLK